MSVTHRLASAFIPTRVAVVGASDREGSRGRAVWSGVMNSRRVLEAYPVNPKYKYIGLTPCWAGLRDLPHTPELCVIATPSARVESVLKDCAALGIANVLVTPGEGTWTEDRLWQDKLAQTARERGIHLIGPDSVGIMRPDIGLNVSYIPKLAAAGPVGLVCQSAALTAAVLDYAAEAGFGFSSVISSGAEAATGLDEIVDFLAADAKTEIIALQILTVRHPRRLMSALKAAARVKPVIILPPGVSPAAGRLSAARLGTPSADPAVFAAAVARTGAACAESLEDFCAALGLLAFGILPKGSRTACAGNGLGVVNLTADAVTQAGLIPAQLSRSTHTALTALTQSPVLMNDPSDLGPEAAGTLVRDAAHDECTGRKPHGRFKVRRIRGKEHVPGVRFSRNRPAAQGPRSIKHREALVVHGRGGELEFGKRRKRFRKAREPHEGRRKAFFIGGRHAAATPQEGGNRRAPDAFAGLRLRHGWYENHPVADEASGQAPGPERNHGP